jgi:hypothetical protein
MLEETQSWEIEKFGDRVFNIYFEVFVVCLIRGTQKKDGYMNIEINSGRVDRCIRMFTEAREIHKSLQGSASSAATCDALVAQFILFLWPYRR